MLNSGTCSNIVVPDIKSKARTMQIIYASCFAYIIGSFFGLGIITKGMPEESNMVMVLTRVQLYTSLFAIFIALWSRHIKSLLRESYKDPLTVFFYNHVEEQNLNAIQVDGLINEQGRRISIYEARKFSKLINRAN